MLTVYLLMKTFEIVFALNSTYQQKVQNEKFLSLDTTNNLKLENKTSLLHIKEADKSNIMQIYNQTAGLNIDGAEHIFLSIIQSPALLFNDNSYAGFILVSLAILLFSPYMYIYSIEGAAVSYFGSLAVGLDIDASTRMQHCLTGMMINCSLSLYLVPSPGSHITGNKVYFALSVHKITITFDSVSSKKWEY